MKNLALLGCGRIAKAHLEALKNSTQAKFIACCDIIKERAEAAAKAYGIQHVYTDYHQMLAEKNLDAVAICTPSGMHADMGADIAAHKVHVISEKPMATNLEDADALIKACDNNNVRLFVVKQNRLNSTMQMLKKAIDNNRFGRIYAVQSNVFWQRPQSYYEAARWRGTWEFDGGAFMNQASHYFDALYWLIGNVDYVMASTATLARNIEAEDTGSAILKFRNGAIGTINVTMLTYPKNYEGSITILGENGTVKVGGVAINKIEKWEFAQYDDDDRLIEQAGYNPPSVYGYGHQVYYNNIISVLNGQAPPETDGRDGRKSLEIITAAYLSAKSGKKISLPL